MKKTNTNDYKNIIGYGSEKTIDEVLDEQRKQDNYKCEKYIKYIGIFFFILPIGLFFTYSLLTNKAGLQDFILNKIITYFDKIIIALIFLYGIDKILKNLFPKKNWFFELISKFKNKSK